jgi:23S rRNA-/tRNA-specific pseudouridylate synthase
MAFFHYKSETPIEVFQFLEQQTQLGQDTLKNLISLGCLYRNGKRWNPTPGEWLQPNDIIRFHPNPKRFLISQLEKIQILQQTSNFVAIYKPPGVPSHETLDNQIENAKSHTRNLISATQLWPLSRLDVGTQGILLFSKSSEFAKRYNHYLSQQLVTKIYHCLSWGSSALKVATYIHWMQKSKKAPKILCTEEELGHQKLQEESFDRCELKILSSQLVTSNNLALFQNSLFCKNLLSHLERQKNFTKRESDQKFQIHFQNVYLNQIQLVTGRTHQIRAQLSKLDHPILGDSLYGSLFTSHGLFENFALACTHIVCEEIGLNVQIGLGKINW